MAFTCPPKDEAEQRIKTLANLKELIKMVDEDSYVPVEMCKREPPSCQCACQCVQQPPPEPECAPCSPPEMMVCYRVTKAKDRAVVKKGGNATGAELKQCNSRELRASILYVGCDCEKRNGLQDDCLRSDCHGYNGNPECLLDPPTCCPSQYCSGKHLGKKKGKGRELGAYVDENGNERFLEEYQCFPAVLAMTPPPPPTATDAANDNCCPCCPVMKNM